MAFWDRIGRALSRIGDYFAAEERPPEPVQYEDVDEYPESVPEYEQGGFGDFFGDEPEERYIEDVPDEPFTYDFGQGPYPDDWGANEKHFWDTVADGLVFKDRENYEDALQDFEGGYLTPGLSPEARDAWRQNFAYDMDMPVFEDWEAFRDYWEEISPPA